MPTTYEQILGGQVNLAAVNFDGRSPAIRSLGRQFVMGCLTRGITPNNINQLMNEFHNFLVGQGWVWNPEIPGNSYVAGARLLDGTVTQGECAYPAYALAYLINAPQPYGFGVGGATVVPYSGANNEGFISNHANALPGPQPNISRPQGGTLPLFYYWANHKVIQLNGQFYDPNYNAQYGALANMAVASMQLVRQNVRLRDLEDYNPLSPWGLLLGWGLPRIAALKFSDLLFGTIHRISVYQAANITNPAVAGHFVEWVENWALPRGGRGNIYGPMPHNPLVR